MFPLHDFKVQSSFSMRSNWDYALTPSQAYTCLLVVRADTSDIFLSWRCSVLHNHCSAHLSLPGKKRSIVLKSKFNKLNLQITFLFKHHYTSHLYIDCGRLYFRCVNRAKNHSQHKKRFKFLAVLDAVGAKRLREKWED